MPEFILKYVNFICFTGSLGKYNCLLSLESLLRADCKLHSYVMNNYSGVLRISDCSHSPHLLSLFFYVGVSRPLKGEWALGLKQWSFTAVISKEFSNSLLPNSCRATALEKGGTTMAFWDKCYREARWWGTNRLISVWGTLLEDNHLSCAPTFVCSYKDLYLIVYYDKK